MGEELNIQNEELEKENITEAYPVKDLIENCEALGYKKEVVAGAFYNCEKAEMTKSEFQKTIQNFLGKKVE